MKRKQQIKENNRPIRNASKLKREGGKIGKWIIMEE